MKTTNYVLLLTCLLGISCSGSQPHSTEKKKPVPDSNPYQVMFYNVENLFDTIDSPDTFDEEFTPEDKKNWNTSRYLTKLNRIGQVINGIDSIAPVALIGVAEIENRLVLEDLVEEKQLREKRWGIVHEQSPDFRGIDVALIYDSAQFTYQSHELLTVILPDTTRTTRDILYVKGLDGESKQLHVFVNHWPSRRGGLEKSEPNRMAAAQTLKKKLDQVVQEQSDARVVIMGDFNDYPDNKSLQEGIDAGNDANHYWINLMSDLDKIDSTGTYNYRGDWGYLDQFIVSPGLSSAVDSCYVFSRNYQLYFNKKYAQWLPARTYGGPNYYGGYSDHLPIVLRLKNSSND